ncbi:425a8576-510b-486d-9fba-df30f82204b6 [Sclerotinia trifoliorum]|uniref:425a8576-510b-486d-9fba-df30f82204b6 n=1 Tax=Sclerotinia trifoliorum TaxID=28548 RepID=A0A8H2ZR79_9HELO|nr:425a8576-510b-486d-9fba-df30f82204b6 [Sclerotinia trifoliorum]
MQTPEDNNTIDGNLPNKGRYYYSIHVVRAMQCKSTTGIQTFANPFQIPQPPTEIRASQSRTAAGAKSIKQKRPLVSSRQSGNKRIRKFS